MRKSLLGVVLAATLLPVSLVHAGVANDLKTKSVDQIVNDAGADGILAVLGDFIDNAPDRAYEAVAAAMAAYPNKIDSIKSYAVSKNLDAGQVETLARNTRRGGGLLGGLNGTTPGMQVVVGNKELTVGSGGQVKPTPTPVPVSP